MSTQVSFVSNVNAGEPVRCQHFDEFTNVKSLKMLKLVYIF